MHLLAALELGYCDLPGLTEAGVPMEELYAAGLKDRPKDGNATAPICIDDDNTITHSSSAGPPTVRPIAGDQASSQGTQIKIKTEAAPTNEDWNKHCYRVVYILLHRLHRVHWSCSLAQPTSDHFIVGD